MRHKALTTQAPRAPGPPAAGLRPAARSHKLCRNHSTLRDWRSQWVLPRGSASSLGVK